MTSMGFPPIFLIVIITQVLSTSGNDGCPVNCICFQDYMSNLASWKWIEKDINIQKDDPLHEDFNPYTEHNEVYDNPVATRKRQREQQMETATCILRTNDSEPLERSMRSLKSTIQVLTLIQVPGSGEISLQKVHFENLNSLIGLEIQGYSSPDSDSSKSSKDSLLVSGDAFENLEKLAYLSLDSIILKQRLVDQAHHSIRTITYNITRGENSEDSVHQSEVIVLKAQSDQENSIVPYSVYKEAKGHLHPIQPKISVAFTKLPLLQRLRISSCNLQDISWDMFYKLDNLKFLLLEKNDLLFLPDFVFYATSNLTALSLSNNKILNLQTVGLVGLLYLQKLDVSYNNITYLSELSLPPFPHLEIADFRHNLIESIFPNTFEIMNSTKILFLGSDSTPLEFSPNSFYGLISLNRLDIINVKLDILERAMLKGMPELRSLTMTGKITRILYDAFSEVPKLEKLILKQCKIRKISMDAFFGLTSLLELDLSHNDLIFLPPGIFDQQVSLREIFLQHNQLTTVPPIFSKLPLKIIRLEDNPWHCSCEMKYWNSKLINQVKRYHIPRNTSCNNFQYDKGSMCKDEEATFQVKYVYEKRVSPRCETPEKFHKKNVFDVLKKGLHYCANTLQQNISILLTSSNPTDKLEIMGTVKLPINENKELERQLLFPPKKPRKVGKTTSTTKANSTGDIASTKMSTLGTTELDNDVGKELIAPTDAYSIFRNMELDNTSKVGEQELSNKIPSVGVATRGKKVRHTLPTFDTKKYANMSEKAKRYQLQRLNLRQG